ncbi:hypothetical protein [Paramicrobacterium chengjingii]|uniref:DUF2567 domain-containing protein n=1 Tax=Paramicrobacterium chengjingii TaxID=2769067 RepID=A0ABX6YGP7_9MICO|nr:hypothetical protein [Microbacterium chengjingii]QPZ37789.1 hypothetical protein HCR76_13340 [Microbacterium chengjingii]
MSNENLNPEDQNGKANRLGYGQQPTYGPSPTAYAVPPVRYPRPPLTRAQRRAALAAGGVGFPLMSLGVALLTVVCTLLLVGTLAEATGAWVDGTSSESEVFTRSLAELWNDAWWIVCGIALAAVVAWVAGYLTSVLVMKRARVNHPIGTTWAGIGVGAVAWWIVSTVIGTLFQIVPFFRLDGSSSSFNDSPVYLIVWTVVLAVASAAVGSFAWWWMAHCLRARRPAQLYADGQRAT